MVGIRRSHLEYLHAEKLTISPNLEHNAADAGVRSPGIAYQKEIGRQDRAVGVRNEAYPTHYAYRRRARGYAVRISQIHGNLGCAGGGQTGNKISVRGTADGPGNLNEAGFPGEHLGAVHDKDLVGIAAPDEGLVGDQIAEVEIRVAQDQGLGRLAKTRGDEVVRSVVGGAGVRADAAAEEGGGPVGGHRVGHNHRSIRNHRRNVPVGRHAVHIIGRAEVNLVALSAQGLGGGERQRAAQQRRKAAAIHPSVICGLLDFHFAARFCWLWNESS